MSKTKKEVTIEEAINKYKVDSENSQELLKNLFDHVLYLDAVVTKLQEDPLGRELYKKIESELKLDLMQKGGQNENSAQ